MNLPPQSPPVDREQVAPTTAELLAEVQRAIDVLVDTARALRTTCFALQAVLERAGETLILEAGDFGRDHGEQGARNRTGDASLDTET